MEHKKRKELTSVFSGHTLIIITVIVSEEQKECGGVKGMMMMFGISPMSFHQFVFSVDLMK